MPGTSKAKNKRGVEITFIEDTHRYFSIIDGKEIDYISGTTFVNHFFPGFDPDGSITRNFAKDHGMTFEEVKNMWDRNSRRACTYGTRIHESMEDRLLCRKLRHKPLDDREKIVFKVVDELSNKIMDKMDVIAIEKIIFDENLKLAGTMDLFARSKKDGKLWILDYKTNKLLEDTSKYGHFGFDPVRHIPDTNRNHYDLQLSLYKYLLKYSGYVDKNENIGTCLIHITENGAKTILARDREKEIKDMIELFKKGNLKNDSKKRHFI